MYYINYKNQELPCIVDFVVIKNVCNKLNLKIGEIEQIINSPANTEIIFFEGLNRGHKLEGKELLLKESDCEDILSENYADFLDVFNQCVLKMFVPTKKN
jgi:hypothetical protein